MASVQPQDDEIQPKVEETQPKVDTVESHDSSQISSQDQNTDMKNNTEVTSTEEDNQSRKPWKKTNLRKKKSNADEHSSDAAQWPTPEEVRNLNTSSNQPQPSSTTEPKQPRSRYNRNSSRSKKGINWKPLEVPNNHAPADAGTTTTGSASTSNHYGPRSSNKRRGGHRGGRGGYLAGHSQNNNNNNNNQTRGSNQQTPEANQQAPSESQGVEAVSPVNSQSNSDHNPPGQNSNAHGEPRQFRNNRYSNRGRGQSYGRGGFYGPKYGSRQNDKSDPHQSRIPSDFEQLKDVIRHQVEYYFSTDNLCKDLFLRENMDKTEGWISIFMILNFRKVRELVNSDKALLVEALKNSPLVEISPDTLHIRRRGDWAAWVIPPLLSKETQVVSVMPQSDSSTLGKGSE